MGAIVNQVVGEMAARRGQKLPSKRVSLAHLPLRF